MFIIKGINHIRLAIADLEEYLSGKLKSCRYCGRMFLPKSLRQEVCSDPACQRKRRNEKQKKYQKKVRSLKNKS